MASACCLGLMEDEKGCTDGLGPPESCTPGKAVVTKLVIIFLVCGLLSCL